MARGTGWTREELLLALRLYMRLPFGKLYGTNPEILAIAQRIGRTGNAVAMKACNFASLDPAFRESGRVGLSATSAADRALWDEFAGDPEAIANEAESLADPVSSTVEREASDDRKLSDVPPVVLPTGPTEVERVVRARRVQSFFRAAVLVSYDGRCALSGLSLPGLLVASHIVPWSASVERRGDPTNGLCLNALFDRAFDRGLLTIDEELRVAVSRPLQENAAAANLDCSLTKLHGRPLHLPHRFRPDPLALAYHRENIFERL